MARPFDSDKKLIPEKIEPIVDGFGKTLSLRRAAGMALESPYHVKRWLTLGEEDVKNGTDSTNAELFLRVGLKLSEKAYEYIQKLEKGEKNMQGLIWLMQTCLRDDYGSESVEFKELLAAFEKLSQTVDRMTFHPLHGARTDGEAKHEGTEKAE